MLRNRRDGVGAIARRLGVWACGWVGAILAAVSFAANAAEPLQVWPVDIHEKIFADTPPCASGTMALAAARNEYESGQFGVFSGAGAENLALSVSPLTLENGTASLPPESIRLRPIRTVLVTKNTPAAENIVVRKAPAEYPDILSEETAISLKPGESKGIWVTIQIPADAQPGRYTGTITLASEAASEAASNAVSAEIPVTLDVFPFTLPSERHLWVTNWFNTSNFAKVHHVKLYSEEYWPILKRYFLNMAEHRQNVVLTPWVPNTSFVKATRRKDGTWSVDFSLLERFLSLAEECGVADRIEFSHCGGIDREKHEVNFVSAQIFDDNEGKVISPDVEEWLAPCLGALEKWLIDTGRIDRAMIHVADEPYQPDMASWRAASERIHAAAPRIKRIDAIESLHFTDDLEVWVPKLTHYQRWQKEFDSLRRDGEEMWYYICCHPFGEHFPNRFMDLPGTRIRAFHWINYTENLCGYLHWGYNYWGSDPFGPPTEQYGPGDTHVVYPGPLDSVRWEIERESLEDYEYFVLLENLSREAAARCEGDLWWFDAKSRGLEIARRAVRAMDDVTTDPSVFADARRELAAAIASLTEGLPLLVRSFPEDGATLVTGPPVTEFYGLTAPGATVTVEGRTFDETTGAVSETPAFEAALTVNPDGTFQYHEMEGRPHIVTFQAALDGKTITTNRRFHAR